MSFFICPICKAPLEHGEKRLFCEHGHSFDISAEGYVHLLPPNKMNSKIPGDSAAMAAARSAFLNKGFYEPLQKALSEAVFELFPKGGETVLDCGCGEGYYTAGIYANLCSKGAAPIMAGVDISRPSVKRAAKRSKNIEFAVASVFDLPAACSSADLVLNVFSPLCREEYLRVLKPGGYYIYVVPGPRHLWQLKAAIYDKPYENKAEDIAYAGFEHAETRRVRYMMNLEHREDIGALFQMTPYYWKTSAKGAEKLASVEKLAVEAAFDIHIYKKEN